jgi:hypothetical protein
MKQMDKVLQLVTWASHLATFCEAVEPNWAGNVSRVGETRNVYRILVQNLFVTIGRQRSSLKYMHIREMCIEYKSLVGLT